MSSGFRSTVVQPPAMKRASARMPTQADFTTESALGLPGCAYFIVERAARKVNPTMSVTMSALRSCAHRKAQMSPPQSTSTVASSSGPLSNPATESFIPNSVPSEVSSIEASSVSLRSDRALPSPIPSPSVS